MSGARKARADHIGKPPPGPKVIEGAEHRAWCNDCRKTAFPGQHSAKAGAKSIGRRRGAPRMRAYQCPTRPGWWHLTNNPKYQR